MAGVFLLNPGAIYQVDTDGNPVSGSTEPTLLNVSGALDSIRKRLDLPVVVTGSNWIPVVTGSVGLSGPITGSVKLTEPITGSVGLSGPITGSVGLSGPITGSVKLTEPITGSVGIAGPVTMQTNSGSYGGRVEGMGPNQQPLVGYPLPIAGLSGSNAVIFAVDSLGRLVTAPAGTTSTSRGFADGFAVLAATTVVVVRSTTYTEPSSNAQRSIASANANDTSAGTGARTVRLTYYTAAFEGPFTETITLNGTSTVNTVASDICYIEKIDVMTVGSGGSNAGIITLYGSTGGGGGTVWTIAAAANRTFSAHHYVPTGKTAYITGFLMGIKGADTTGGHIRSKSLSDATASELQISDSLRAPSSGQSFRSYGTPIVVAGPSRISAFAAPDSTSSRTYYASFDYYEE